MDEESVDKRRRNLIVVSLALLAAMWSNTVVGDFKLFDVAVRPPVTLPLAWYLWPFWLYFLLRFVQVFELGNINTPYRNKLRSLLQDHTGREVPDVVKRYEPQLREGEQVLPYAPEMVETRNKVGWVGISQVDRVIGAQPIGAAVRVLQEREMMPASILRGFKLRAWWHITFRTSPVLDHAAPFVIAAVPVLYAGWRAIKVCL